MKNEINNRKSENTDAAIKNPRSGLTVCMRLIGLVKSLAGFMVGAVTMGLAGHLCASFITILAGYALLSYMGYNLSLIHI